MKYLLDMAKMKAIELERQNKLILQKTNDILQEWKGDYIKVIDVLKEKEKNLEICQTEIEHKKNKIFTLEERLISISILEKKIKFLKEEFDRDTKKLVNTYEIKLKETGDPYRVAPNLVVFHNEKLTNVMKNEKKNSENQMEMFKTINNQRDKEKILSFKLKQLNVDSEIKGAEILKLKEKIAAQNKEFMTFRSKNNSKLLIKSFK